MQVESTITGESIIQEGNRHTTHGLIRLYFPRDLKKKTQSKKALTEKMPFPPKFSGLWLVALCLHAVEKTAVWTDSESVIKTSEQCKNKGLEKRQYPFLIFNGCTYYI